MSLDLATSLKSARPSLTVIGEVKTKSPYGYEASYPWAFMLEKLIVHPAIDIVSIHTNPLWGGSWEQLKTARELTRKPILAKGFHDTIADVKAAFDHGADYCLTVGWWPDDDRCWFEYEHLDQLSYIPAKRVVFNARDPRTGWKRPWVVNRTRAIHPGWLCQASMIRTVTDVHPAVDAVLIGEALWS